MKKKLIPILLVVVLLISVFPAYAVETEPTFVVDSVTAEAGETVDVTISVKNNPGIASIKLSVAYNEVLTLNSITYNAAIGGMSQQPQSKDSPVTLNWFNGAADSHGDWLFATLSFTVNTNADIGNYDVTITYKADNVYNIAEENVTFAVENGKVEVICGHNNTTSVAEIPATCNQTGFTAGIYCNDCQTYISGHEVIPATGNHVDADGKWNKDGDHHFHICECGKVLDKAAHTGGKATCTAKAACSVCGSEYGSVDGSNHTDLKVLNAVSATCSQNGYSGDTYCMDCNKLVAGGKVIPATGAHVDADGKWEQDADGHFHTCDCGTVFEKAVHTGGEATCTMKAVCDVCGAFYGAVDQSKHSGTVVKDALKATCAQKGYTGDTYCKDCGVLLQTGEEIPATGIHSYGQWIVTLEPTVETAGQEEQTCGDCGHKVIREIPPLTPDEPEDKPSEKPEDKPVEKPEDKPTQEPIPETGDMTVVGIILLTAVIACAGILLMYKKRALTR